MRRRFLLQSALAFLLLLAVATSGARLLRLVGGPGLDLGGYETSTLDAATIGYLQELDENLDITCFFTVRQRMPSSLKDVEDQVRRLLAEMARRAPQRLDYRILYPELGGLQGIAYAARRKASSVTVSRVLRDEHDEESVWSSLVLACGDRGEALIQGVGPADLPHLGELIVERLKVLRQPPRPVIAVAAPQGYGRLRGALREYGEVLDVDLDRRPEAPMQADVLFWMEPAAATPEHVRQLLRFVDAGRTVVLAGSSYGLEYLRGGSALRCRVTGILPAWQDLLRPLGLQPAPDLLMDTNTGPAMVRASDGAVLAVETPFHLRCLPAFYDMRSFAGPARGGLSFAAAGPLQVDVRGAAAAGFQAEIVGTTTAEAWVAPLPPGEFSPSELDGGARVGKQNLMVLLKSDDPWRGQVLVLASPALLRDGSLDQPGYGHRVFLRTLMRTFGDADRLARLRVVRRHPQRLTLPGPAARAFWRLATVFAVPLALLAAGLWRSGGAFPRGRASLRRVAAALGSLGIALAVAQSGRLGVSVDATEERRNTASPTFHDMVAHRGELSVELVVPAPGSVPPSLRDVERRVGRLFDDIGVPLRRVRPGRLDAAGLAALRADGLEPFPVERVLQDSVAVEQVWSGLRLDSGGRRAVVPKLDGRTVEHAEFLTAAALLRLEGDPPLVAVVADMPRLSPAEALEDYHRKGLIPPSGVGAYSEASRLLSDYGYRVAYVDPRQPDLPAGTDLLLWLQPRRDATAVLLLLGDHLARGGRALVAVQHFNIQQRQYRGAGFQTVYWPQPQFQDIDRYLRLWGAEQVREVLMDRTRSHLELETQVNRTAVREYDPQQVALPFLIRAVPAYYDRASPLTSRLGDLLFIWGNRFAFDRQRLEDLGLRSSALITTSDQAWAYAWHGGWLPPEAFSPSEYLPGGQPLVVLVEGRFPDVSLSDDGAGTRELVPLPPRADASPGSLLLIGCSEMFKNDYLHVAGFDHGQLLLNAVALLTYGEEMARLQARRPAVRGFAHQSPAARTAWRIAVVALGPLGFGLVGLLRHLRSARR